MANRSTNAGRYDETESSGSVRNLKNKVRNNRAYVWFGSHPVVRRLLEGALIGAVAYAAFKLVPNRQRRLVGGYARNFADNLVYRKRFSLQHPLMPAFSKSSLPNFLSH